MAVRFGVLGPLQVWCSGTEVPLPAGKHRALLATLLLRANRTVSVSELIVRIWGDHPPATARATIQTYVGRLRRALGDGLIGTRPDGYLVVVTDEQLDLAQFDRLVKQSRTTEDQAQAARLLAQAVALWRGPALADVPSEELHRRDVPALVERRLSALERLIDVELAAGRGADGSGDLVAELRKLTAEHPLRERFWAQLITALTTCGRQADALQAYQDVRTALCDELGVDPGSELQRLHLSILRGGSPPAPGSGPDSAPRPVVTATDHQPSSPVPAQLPPDVAGFTGRVHDLHQLDASLAGEPAGAVPIVAIEGMAGVGKTALAVHWSHRVRERFPDGQLYLDLRGYGPGSPLRPIEALARLLQALGVPSGQVPVDVEAATALYRSVVADRRLLVLLDDAVSPEQVRPLLPGGRGCLVLVTSRNRLVGLVALEGARPLRLGVLTAEEAQQLLTGLLGAERTGTEEPAAVAELATLCGHLPLALRIAAANLTTTPALGLAVYSAQLRDHGRLAAFAVAGDDQAAVAAAFDLSYARLPDTGRRLFRLLGLAPGPDISAEAAAALAGLALERAEAELAALAAAHLVEQPAPDRYRLHDLLRRYAVDRAGQDDSPAEQQAARNRLYDHYLRRAQAAAATAYPQVLRLPATEAGAGPEAFPEPDAALAWLAAEETNLAATISCAAAHGPRPVAWRLADCLRGYLWQRRSTVAWPAVAGDALAAAEADQEPAGQAAARLSMGDLDLLVGRFAASVGHYRAALPLAGRTGWTNGQAAALGQLGIAYRSLGQLPQAAEHHALALARYRETGRRGGEAVCLGNLGVVCEELGQLRKAATYTAQALSLFRQFGSRAAEANALGNLGRLEQLLGKWTAATTHLTAALALHQESGQPSGEATALADLAVLHRDRGDLPRAQELATAAVALTHEIGDRFFEAAARNTLASVHLELGRPELAGEHHRHALALARKTGDRTHECGALLGLAAAQRPTGKLDEALANATAALTLASDACLRSRAAHAHAVLAEVHTDRSDHPVALTHARQALAIHTEAGYRLGQARDHTVLGDLCHRAGDTEAAGRHRYAARALLASLGLPSR